MSDSTAHISVTHILIIFYVALRNIKRWNYKIALDEQSNILLRYIFVLDYLANYIALNNNNDCRQPNYSLINKDRGTLATSNCFMDLVRFMITHTFLSVKTKTEYTPCRVFNEMSTALINLSLYFVMTN